MRMTAAEFARLQKGSNPEINRFIKMQKKPVISEKSFQDGQVIPLLELHGWLVYHTHDSRRSQAGFPDLVAVRGERTIFAELKSETGQPTAEQYEWLVTLHQAGNEVYLWRPSDFEEIEKIVKRLSGEHTMSELLEDSRRIESGR